jgi:hypothetical protein
MEIIPPLKKKKKKKKIIPFKHKTSEILVLVINVNNCNWAKSSKFEIQRKANKWVYLMMEFHPQLILCLQWKHFKLTYFDTKNAYKKYIKYYK